ncbi:MAG: hypothetical protein LBT95_03450 [Treponema sp.]|nr:hypothetical protein [Treponema sp.]
MKYKNKIELFFLFVLCNALVVTIIAMISVTVAGKSRIFAAILMNSGATFLVTVPLFVYKATDIKKTFYWFIPIAFITAFVLCNMLIHYNKVMFISLPVIGLFTLLFIPVFRKKGKPEKNSFEHTLARMGIITFCIVSVLSVVSVFIFSSAHGESGYYASYPTLYLFLRLSGNDSSYNYRITFFGGTLCTKNS